MTPQAAQTVDRELLKVGRIGVSTEISDAASIELPPPSFKEIRGTDCVAQAGRAFVASLRHGARQHGRAYPRRQSVCERNLCVKG